MLLLALAGCFGLVRNDPPSDVETGTPADTATDTAADTGGGGDTGSAPDSAGEICAVPEDACATGTCAYSAVVDLVTLSGTVTYAGATLPDDPYTSADYTVLVTNVETGDASSRSWSAGEDYAFDLPAGTYSLSVSFASNGTEGMPDAPVVAATALSLGRDRRFDVAVEAHVLSGSVTWNGGDVPDDPYTGADYRVTVVDVATGATAAGDFASGQEWSFVLPGGVYDAYVSFPYNSTDGLLDVPARAAQGLAVYADASRALAVSGRTVSGSVSYDGAPVPDDPYTSADVYVYATNVETGERATAAYSAGQSYAFTLPVGTYDLSVSFASNSTAGLPDITVLAADDLAVTADTTRNLGITPAVLSGALVYAGGAVPDDPYTSADARVYATDTTTGEVASVSVSSGQPYQLALVPGTYDLTVSFAENSTAGMIDTVVLAAEDVTLSSSRSENLAITPYVLTGAVTLDGAAVPDDPYTTADYTVTVSDAASGAVASANFSAGEDYRFVLPPGRYDLAVSFPNNSTAGVPDVPMVAASGVAVLSDTTRALGVRGFPLTGDVTWEGSSGSAYGLAVSELSTGVGAEAWFTSGVGYSLVLPEGVYAVRADLGGYGETSVVLAECLEIGP
jgi:hypothetical protein